MKSKQIKLYSFDRHNISGGKITSKDLQSNIVSISESFFTLAYAERIISSFGASGDQKV